MPGDILVVGNCAADNALLANVLDPIFAVTIQSADQGARAAELMSRQRFDLVLVNRIFDATGESGLDWIRDRVEAGIDVPLLIMTNYADHLDAARQLGAAGGFGKRDLYDPSTRQLLERWLPLKPGAVSGQNRE